MDKNRWIAVALFVAPLAFSPPASHAGDEKPAGTDPVRLVLADDPNVAANAVRVLRERGQAGLDALLAAYAEPLESASPGFSPDPRITRAVDAVAAQKDARFSRLFWHTDLRAALRAASAEKKAVLSLRLLGRLDEDLSCANSRFFRTALYPDPEIGALLREKFVLHWKSERPVPKVTIDFGDGRVLQRTVAGNSVHYVLDGDGRVIDAIPGLYGPKAFREAIRSAAALLDEVRAGVVDRVAYVTAWHAAQVKEIERTRAEDRAAVGVPADREPDDEAWRKIAARHADDAKLSDASRALFDEKTNARTAGRRTVGKSWIETPILDLFLRFERSVAEDAVRNEMGFHLEIHRWLSNPKESTDLDSLNRRVYSDLFLTPASDPWLGLLQRDAYQALDGSGWLPKK